MIDVMPICKKDLGLEFYRSGSWGLSKGYILHLLLHDALHIYLIPRPSKLTDLVAEVFR